MHPTTFLSFLSKFIENKLVSRWLLVKSRRGGILLRFLSIAQLQACSISHATLYHVSSSILLQTATRSEDARYCSRCPLNAFAALILQFQNPPSPPVLTHRQLKVFGNSRIQRIRRSLPFDAFVTISNMPDQPAVIIIARFVVCSRETRTATDSVPTDTATDWTQQTKAGTLLLLHLMILL